MASEAMCDECGQVYTPVRRRQGGGKSSLTCSPKCRQARSRRLRADYLRLQADAPRLF